MLCTIPHNPEVGTPVADFMNGNVTRGNEMIHNLIRSNPGELRLMDLENTLRMADYPPQYMTPSISRMLSI